MLAIKGTVEMKITSASPSKLLSLLSKNGIRLENVRFVDELHVLITIERKQYRLARKLVISKGDSFEICDRFGTYWSLKGLAKRPVFTFGLLIFFLITLYLPTRVLFITVSGNDRISTNRILEGAEICGIYFGASRKAVRSEKVKNRLLSEIPELKWAGINTYGCLAVISVDEKSQESNTTSFVPFGNLIANHDAIVTEISALRGTILCKVGQAVVKDQILISGYENLGICVKGVGAKGEVYGLTNRKLTLFTPAENVTRSKCDRSEKKYGILLGKKLINFSKYSGIYDSRCVRMYTYNYIYLPGGFRLPIAWVTEEILYYEAVEASVDAQNNLEWLHSAATNYVTMQMLSGEILKTNTSIKENNGAYYLQCSFRCHEMIGRVRREEIVQEYG